MNKTMKIALCIGLTGLGMFVWTHFAAAKGKPAQAPVVVTFIAGDVSAVPQMLNRGPQGGPFTATIDFAKHLAYGVGGGTVPEWQDIIKMLDARNPITYDALTIAASDTLPGGEGKPINTRLDFRVVIDGVKWTVTMNAFLNPGLTEITPTLKTYHWHEGRFAISKGSKQVMVAGCYGGRPSVDLSMTR